MIAFGVFYYAIAALSRDLGWFLPIYMIRMFTAVLVAPLAIRQRPEPHQRLTTRITLAILAIGAIEIGGMFAFARGAQVGNVAIVAAVSSAYTLVPIAGAIALTPRASSPYPDPGGRIHRGRRASTEHNVTDQQTPSRLTGEAQTLSPNLPNEVMSNTYKPVSSPSPASTSKLFFRAHLRLTLGREVVRLPMESAVSPPLPGYLSTRAIRNRTTGLSLIGKCTMAANTPKPTPAHHIAS